MDTQEKLKKMSETKVLFPLVHGDKFYRGDWECKTDDSRLMVLEKCSSEGEVHRLFSPYFTEKTLGELFEDMKKLESEFKQESWNEET